MLNNKIQVIKILRDVTDMSLKDAKCIVETIEPYMNYGGDAGAARIKELESAVECFRADLHSLIRLVDYFVAHPDLYAAWKATHS